MVHSSRLIIVTVACLITSEKETPLSPIEARKRVGETTTVQMTVSSAKDRLEKRGEIYLYPEQDFQNDKNFAIVIT